MTWETIHLIRGAYKEDHIVGYRCSSKDECWSLFLCASHGDAAYFQGWIPVTIKDTHQQYYQCDRFGCEMGYWHELIDEDDEE